jgi:chloramphenicol 3-O-phosphotransferase
VPDVSALLVTGPVSSGKTSLGRALQSIAADPWLLWEADKCQPPFPSDRFPDHVTVETDRAMRLANLRAAHAYIGVGFNVFVEVDLADSPDRDAGLELFGAGAMTVAVLCDRSVVERRTAARPDRDVAWALRHYDSVNWNDLDADIWLHSDQQTPEDLAREVIARMQQRDR